MQRMQELFLYDQQIIIYLWKAIITGIKSNDTQRKAPEILDFSGFVALFRYSVKLSFAELRTLDFTELFGGLKSFRINKTLKLSALQFSFCWCLKSFRINKTLKLFESKELQSGGLKSFRINKTLKLTVVPRIRRKRLKSFRIKKTLKLVDTVKGECFRLKSFRINKTLKRTWYRESHWQGLKSFRINKTLKPYTSPDTA